MENQHLGQAKHFTLGRIVTVTTQAQFGLGDKFGHVVGFSLNSQNEILVVVQFPTKESGAYEVKSYHPSNLTIV